MRLALAADHAGHDLMRWLADRLGRQGHDISLLGPAEPDPADDYPDRAVQLSRALQEGRAERGLLVCGSGVGAAVAANKMKGIRAGLCHDAYSAAQGVEHDDINVLCLGARIIGVELAWSLVQAFLAARFSGEDRHRRRLGKITTLEDGWT